LFRPAAGTAQGARAAVGASGERALVDGETMYRKGILPSGKPMPAAMQGGVSLPGTTFACAGCHTRSGLGTMEEGGLRTLPVNGPNLFQPLYHFFPGLSPSEREELPQRFKGPALRPAYTDATLSTAIRKGTDPNGRSFNPVMPRYPLSDPDMAILVGYLKQLSSRPSPGVTETSIALATVITDDVVQGDRDAMLAPLDRSVQAHNNLGTGHMSQMVSMGVMGLAYRRWTLAHWLLTGPPDTWRAQLERFYKAEPVFALVGGISNQTWAPIHRFCEDHQIPCVLPITDFPEISRTDYYTLYSSKGYYQEGAAVARYLAGSVESGRPWNLVEVLGPGPEAAALAAGFRDEWAGAGGGPIKTFSVGEQQPLTAESLSRLLPAGQDSVLTLWTGSDSYGALRALAAAPNRPASVFLSSTLLAGSLWDLPSEARSFTYVAYPFREPGQKTLPPRMGRMFPVVVNKEYLKNDRRIASRTETVVAVLTDALIRMERNFYRDHLLDLIDAMPAQDQTDYELLNFSPGQRYLSETCHIMRLSEGPSPVLIRMSE
jgi:hypothetical protein